MAVQWNQYGRGDWHLAHVEQCPTRPGGLLLCAGDQHCWFGPQLERGADGQLDLALRAAAGGFGQLVGGRRQRIGLNGRNNGSVQGGTLFAPGMVGQAFSFNPASGTVVVPDSPSLRLTNQVTIEAWINAHTLSVSPGLRHCIQTEHRFR